VDNLDEWVDPVEEDLPQLESLNGVETGLLIALRTGAVARLLELLLVIVRRYSTLWILGIYEALHV